VPTYTFTLNGQQVTVDAPGNLGLLYVLRDILGVTGPKYGCGVGVCAPAPATSTARRSRPAPRR